VMGGTKVGKGGVGKSKGNKQNPPPPAVFDCFVTKKKRCRSFWIWKGEGKRVGGGYRWFFWHVIGVTLKGGGCGFWERTTGEKTRQ